MRIFSRIEEESESSTSLIELPVPSYMGYKRPFKIYLNETTGLLSTSYNESIEIPILNKVPEAIWYVNGLTGNDANDGLTPETALKKISTAILKNTSTGWHIIYVEGNQEYDESIGWGANIPPSQHQGTIVLARNGRVKCSSRVVTNGAWVQVGSTEEWTYTKSAAADYSGMVRDAKVMSKDLDAKYYLDFETYGDETVYTLGTAGSLARGQYSFTGPIMTIRCIDGRNPNSDNLVTVELNVNGAKHGTNGDLYVSGFDFSGSIPFNMQMGKASQRAVFDECTFKYAYTSSATNGLTAISDGTIILNRCSAALNLSDNFNFKEEASEVGKGTSYHFGIDCVSRKAGLHIGVAILENENCLTGHNHVKGEWINTWCWGSQGPTSNYIDHAQVAMYGGGADGSTATGNEGTSVAMGGTGEMLLWRFDAGTVISANGINTATGGTTYYFDVDVSSAIGGGTYIEADKYGAAI
jgi:hypothetical protein